MVENSNGQGNMVYTNTYMFIFLLNRDKKYGFSNTYMFIFLLNRDKKYGF